jgi:hypothetical protein
MTKAGAKYRARPELLADWSETTIVPCCAIGGNGSIIGRNTFPTARASLQ